MSKQTILVTGGNGFVGVPLCRFLVGKGHQVISLSRSAYETRAYESVVGNVTDPTSIAGALAGFEFDIVIHLVSMLVSASAKNPGMATRVNTLGTLHLMEYCAARGVRRFIYGSSYNAMGTQTGYAGPVPETAPASPSDFYGETKRYCECLGETMHANKDLEFAATRMSIILGPGTPSPTSAWRTDVFNLLSGGGKIAIPFHQDEVLPMAHFQDVAEGIAAVALAPTLAHTIYNLPGESMTAGELAAAVRGRGRGVDVSCGSRLLTGIPHHVDSQRIRTEIGFQPWTLAERMQAFCEEAA